MSRRRLLIAAAVVVIVAAAWGLWWILRPDRDGADPELVADQPAAAETAPAVPVLCNLYFPGPGGWLYVERQELSGAGEPVERITEVVAALLAGPQGTSLRPPLPDGVTLGRAYLLADGTAMIDLESVDRAPPPASGSRREMLTVYSLVNSVVLNVPEVERLVLLWNGEQPSSFAGHLDTARPLVPNRWLVAGSP